MKNLFVFIICFFFSLQLFAGSLVMMSYQSQEELESLFRRDDLSLHHYSNDWVIATAEVFNAEEMVLLEKAFEETDMYCLVYCCADRQESYLQRERQNGHCLYRNEDFLVMKPVDKALRPYKNDGMVAIFNNEAVLPRLPRDFPVVSAENPK